MFETRIKTVDGVRFYSDIRVLEPDGTMGGFPVHYVPSRVALDKELMRAIKIMGFRKVGRDMARDSDAYAQIPTPFIWIKVVQCLLTIYWVALRWVYDNARFFKQIPPNECFSWRYFTPYVWYGKLRR